MNHKNVKVTTTSGFDGVKIDQYLEPVTAHIAVGMNFFKDFLSGFSDFFGGKSKSYQNVLESINLEAINQLRLKANAVGANCIVGLKIDNDEISAQGKSMLMVTAIGTAAKGKFEEYHSEHKTLNNERVSRELFKMIAQKNDYIQAGKNGDLTFDDSFWEFVKKYQIFDVADFILERYENDVNNFVVMESLEREVIDYFSEIDPQRSREKLYSYFVREGSSKKMKKKLVELISKLNFLEFDLVMSLLKSKEFETQKFALSLLSSDKGFYTNKDLIQLQNVIEILPNSFPIRGTLSTKKKVLSSKEKEIWICECKKENEIDSIYCSNCSNDIYGFNSDDFKLDKALNKLKKDLSTLKEVLEIIS